ncbi:MAG: hypothetical protein MRY83_08245 [Flavobacteriales bacterium]|nr:hypothetical protein [Flavobacteriales bacterium]
MPKEIEVKSVLNKTKRRDPWFLDDYTFNPYSSCSFNCLYCYIRGSKYGENLAESLSVKTNAIEILEKQLSSRAKKEQYGYIVISSATDPYLKIEKEYQLTRAALEIIEKYRFPVHVITKSDLVERDFDLLKKIDSNAIIPKSLNLKRGVIMSFSFSTIEDQIGALFESGATKPSLRINTVRRALSEDFLTGISFMPLIPYISDTTSHLTSAFAIFQNLGVDYILPATITLFGNGKSDSKTLIMKMVQKHFPELIDKYNKFFENSNQMPEYYRKAFKAKMQELCAQYDIPQGILLAEKGQAIREYLPE